MSGPPGQSRWRARHDAATMSREDRGRAPVAKHEPLSDTRKPSMPTRHLVLKLIVLCANRMKPCRNHVTSGPL